MLPAGHVRMWNDLPHTVFDTETLDGSRVQSTVGCFPELCFLQFALTQVLVGLRKQLMNNFVFPTWACDAGFNNNNNKAEWCFLFSRACIIFSLLALFCFYVLFNFIATFIHSHSQATLMHECHA